MPTDAALKLHSVVGSQALQLLCLSSARQTREFAYGILREIARIDCQSEEVFFLLLCRVLLGLRRWTSNCDCLWC